MKWIKLNRDIDRIRWHRWFAWKPVTVFRYPDGSRRLAWMCWVGVNQAAYHHFVYPWIAHRYREAVGGVG